MPPVRRRRVLRMPLSPKIWERLERHRERTGLTIEQIVERGILDVTSGYDTEWEEERP